MNTTKEYKCDRWDIDQNNEHAPICNFRQDHDSAPCRCGGTYRLVKEFSKSNE